MRSLFIAVLTAVTLLSLNQTEARAQQQELAVIESFYHNYLYRPPTRSEMEQWRTALTYGTSLFEAEAKVLASEEFFLQTHNDHRRYVQLLYGHILNQPVGRDEIEYWIFRLNTLRSREEMTKEFLAQARGVPYQAPTPGPVISPLAPVIPNSSGYSLPPQFNGGPPVSNHRPVIRPQGVPQEAIPLTPTPYNGSYIPNNGNGRGYQPMPPHNSYVPARGLPSRIQQSVPSYRLLHRPQNNGVTIRFALGR